MEKPAIVLPKLNARFDLDLKPDLNEGWTGGPETLKESENASRVALLIP